MYMSDRTGQQIATTIGNLSIDTTGLVKDTTLQAQNTILSQIKASIDTIKITPVYLNDRKSSAQAVDVPTATHTSILQLALTDGLWIISGTIFNPNLTNATGYRQVYIASADDSTSPLNSIETIQNAIVGALTATTISGVVEMTSSGNIYLRFRHNQGNNINAFGILNAVKVG